MHSDFVCLVHLLLPVGHACYIYIKAEFIFGLRVLSPDANQRQRP